MSIKLTQEQALCVKSEGNTLVAAAAGSGKTAVLVERVINKLCSKTKPISADKLLIVTFTNAAAAEMRGRIEKRLLEECEKNPNDAGLIRQKHLLGTAKICTIDSFCIDLVRENFEKAGVSPDFKMSEGNSLRPYDERVLSKIINRYLEEKNETFSALLDIIGAEYDDFNFLEFVLELYYFSRQLPFPTKWFESLSDFYSEREFTKNSPWWNYAFKTADTILADAQGSISKAIDLVTVEEKAADKFISLLSGTAKIITELKEASVAEDWDKFHNLLFSVSLPDMPRLSGVSGIYEINAVKSIYKYIRDKAFESLKKIFYANLEQINSQFEMLYEPLKLLTEILKEFEQDIFDEYLKINTFTFHNTEQLALSLLCKENNGEISIREDAAEFLDRFDEVMVDEYQDTNDLQDMLFYVLSAREKKLFVVGDVKQSIYGFRGANPKNFLEKKNRYIPFEKADSDDAKKIILSKNFRTKPEVCEFINFFFKCFMSDKTGDIVYNSEEALTPAACYPETNQSPVELGLISCKDTLISPIIAEARYIAKRINEIMSGDAVIRLSDTELRKARYSDFAVLLRSVKNKAPILADELKRQGIPVDFPNESFAENYEIATMLSLLKVIDNPSSDIELLSVMMSPLFSFSAEEMAKIRTYKKGGDFYSALLLSANVIKKTKRFLKEIEKFRLAAVTLSLPNLIRYLINTTDYLDIVTALSDGERRRGNLLLLSTYAKQYSESGEGSIGGFIKYILKQSERGIKGADSASGGDAVKIMSIHASKGLQFPVTIISGISSAFNDGEAAEATLYSTDFGIGFKYFDEQSKTKVTTIGREVILERIRRERLEEELRLFYVALTRTQDKLILVGGVSDREKKAEEMKTLLISAESEITSALWGRTKSYLDWVLLSCLIHPDGKALRGNGSSLFVRPTKSNIEINLFSALDLPNNVTEKENVEILPDDEIVSSISKNISYKYPFQDILEVESKASVSAIANKAESAKYAFSSEPSFMSKGGITATGRGTAMHKVMQFIDFEKFGDIESEIERLYEWQFISEEEANSINRRALSQFFQSEIFSRILKSNTVKREMKFLTELSAKKIAPHLSEEYDNEKIIVQGAVDICFLEDDGVVVLDFKTDRVSSPDQLIKAYGEQLSIYAFACEKIFKKPVKEKLIYSFSLERTIKIK